MKKIQSNLKSLFFIGVLFFVITGCDLFNKEASIDTAQLVGLWTISDAGVVPEIAGLPIKNYFTDVLGSTVGQADLMSQMYSAILEEMIGGTIEFKDDNTYIINFIGDIDDGNWALNSDGDVIIIDPGTSDEQLITIQELTSSTLKISYDELSTEDIDDNPDTPDVEVALKIEMTLTK